MTFISYFKSICFPVTIDGGDAIAICSSISVKAEGTFDGSNNPGAIVFATAPNNGPTDRLKVTNEGHFVPIADTSYDLGVSGSLHFRDVCLSGIVFDDGTYQTTAATAGGSDPTGTASGVAFFGDDNLLTTSSSFEFDNTNTGIYLYRSATDRLEIKPDDVQAYSNVYNISAEGGTNREIVIRPANRLIVSSLDNNSRGRIRLGANGSFYGDITQTSFGNLTLTAFRDNGQTSLNLVGGTAAGDDRGIQSQTFHRMQARLRVDGQGDFRSGIEVIPAVSTDIPLVVQGAASQSANLQEWQNSSSVVQAYIDETGGFSGTSVTINDYALPLADGSANQVLTTDGAGNVTFEDAAGGGGDATPSGNSTEFQYNNGGVFGGTTGVVYEATNGTGILLKVHGTGSPKDNLFSVEYTGVNAETTVSIYRNNSTDTANLFQVRTEASGDLFTVSPTGKVYERSSHGNVEHSGSASSFTFDLDSSNIFTATLSSTSSTVSIANGDVGQRFILRLTNGVANAKVGTWFSNINWPGGNPASGSLVNGETNLFGFLTYSGNGGTLYHDGFAIATGVT